MPVTFTVNAKTAEWTFDEERGKTSGSTVHIVTATEPTTPALARTATGLIAIGGDYPDTPAGSCPCTKRKTSTDDARIVFRVQCDFDSTRGTTLTSPLDAPVKVSTTSENKEETYYVDRTTPTPKYAKHTNDVAFSELPKRDVSTEVLEIEKNVVSTTTRASVRALNNKVNVAAVTIEGENYAIGTLRQMSYSLSEVKTENGVSYRTLRRTVKYDPDGFDQKFESLGFKTKDGATILDAQTNPEPVTEPYPLTTAGTRAANRTVAGAEIILKPYTTTSFAGIA